MSHSQKIGKTNILSLWEQVNRQCKYKFDMFSNMNELYSTATHLSRRFFW